MFASLKKTALAAVAATSLLMMAGPSHAVTFNTTNDIVDGGSYDIFGGPYAFGVFFDAADPPTVFSFDFFNSSATDATVGITIGTLLQAFSRFTGGVTVAWTAGGSVFLPAAVGGPANPSRNQGFTVFTNLAAGGGSDTLTLTFGNSQGVGRPGLQMNVSALIPLPAGGLLLLGALGGLAALRRRKMAA